MSKRTIYDTADPGNLQLVYRTGVAPDYAQRLKYSLWNILIPCSCTCFHANKLAAATYVEVNTSICAVLGLRSS